MIRRTLFGAIICLTVLSSSNAELLIKKGLKGGVNISRFSSDADVDYSSKAGVCIGGYAKINLVKIALQGEVLYSQKGAKISEAHGDTDLQVTYLEIPLMVKFQRHIVPLVSYNVHAGPVFAAKLSEETNPKYDGDVFQGTDVGICLGLGFNASALISELNAEVRYTWGLTNIWDGDGNSEVKNKTLTLLVGLGL